MLDQDVVHIGCEADLAAHVLDVRGKHLSVKGLLDTRVVVSVMPISTWTDMVFDRLDLIPTNIRLAVANQGAINVAGRIHHFTAARRKASLDEFSGRQKS